MPARILTDMSNRDIEDRKAAETAFADPVEYLAGFGIEAELVAEATLPAAA